jgi:hypothetical protein
MIGFVYEPPVVAAAADAGSAAATVPINARSRRWRTRLSLGSGGSRVLLFAAVYVAIVAGGAALRMSDAEHHTPPRSADEQAYLALGRSLGNGGPFAVATMNDPLHWPPGTPALFGAARWIGGSPANQLDPESVYTAQAVVSTLGIGAAILLAVLIAGPWAGFAAGAATAFYQPLDDAAARALSEPLGGLALTLALAALVWAFKRGSPWRFWLAGVLAGATVLVRADLLVIVVLLAAWAFVALRRVSRRTGLLSAAAVVAGALLITGPWILHASARAGHFVPVSTAGGSAFYVGTYLPGHGTVDGFKRAVAPAVRRQMPYYRTRPVSKIPQEKMLDIVAARDRGLGRAAALRKEAWRNVSRYGGSDPIGFSGMLLAKAARMWTTPTRQSAYQRLKAIPLAIHILLVGLALAGLGIGLILRRSAACAAILLVAASSTAVNAVFLSEPRHLLPLAPALFAGGAAGWALLVAGRTRRPT